MTTLTTSRLVNCGLLSRFQHDFTPDITRSYEISNISPFPWINPLEPDFAVINLALSPLLNVLEKTSGQLLCANFI